MGNQATHSSQELDAKTRQWLASVPFFQHLGDEDLHTLSSLFVLRHVEPFTPIVEAGDSTRDFYLVVEHSATVFITDEQGKLRAVTRLDCGSYFGEISLLRDGFERTATVKADEQGCRLLMLTYDMYAKHASDSCLRVMSHMIKHCAQHKLIGLLKKVPFLSSVPDTKLEKLSGLVRLTRKQPGEIICREGSPGNCLYVIVSGSVQVVSEGLQPV